MKMGVTIAIVGILVTVVLFAVGNCDDTSSEKIRLDNLVTTQGEILKKLNEDLQRNLNGIDGIQEFIRKNDKFIRHGELIELMDNNIRMASRAVNQMGQNCEDAEVPMNDRERQQWLSILSDVGFNLDEPITEVMSTISDSSIAILMPVRTLLAIPWHACEFVKEMRNWKNKSDEFSAEFFFELVSNMGIDHPSAGTELQAFLSNEQNNLQQISINLNQQISELNTKYKSNLGELNNTKLPFYCGTPT